MLIKIIFLKMHLLKIFYNMVIYIRRAGGGRDAPLLAHPGVPHTVTRAARSGVGVRFTA